MFFGPFLKILSTDLLGGLFILKDKKGRGPVKQLKVGNAPIVRWTPKAKHLRNAENGGSGKKNSKNKDGSAKKEKNSTKSAEKKENNAQPNGVANGKVAGADSK